MLSLLITLIIHTLCNDICIVSAHAPILKVHSISSRIYNGITIGFTNGISHKIVLPAPNASLGQCITIRYHYLWPNIIAYLLRCNIIHLRHVSLMLLIILIPINICCDNLRVTLKIFSLCHRALLLPNGRVKFITSLDILRVHQFIWCQLPICVTVDLLPILSQNLGSECRPNIKTWPTVPSLETS